MAWVKRCGMVALTALRLYWAIIGVSLRINCGSAVRGVAQFAMVAWLAYGWGGALPLACAEEPPRKIVCGVLAGGVGGGAISEPQASAVAAEIEHSLGLTPGVSVVEREAVAALLREKQLAALTLAGGVGDRVRAGRMLHADALILVGTMPSADHAGRDVELTVCETAQGLRLAHTVVGGDSAGKAACASVAEALRLIRAGVHPLVAVPAMSSNDLLYASEPLRAMYARALEGDLTQGGRVIAVELAEADALAREAALAGDNEAVRRALPVYVLGAFRHEPAAAGQVGAVAFSIHARRGVEEVWSREATVAESDVPSFLTGAANDILRAVLGSEMRAGTSAQAAPDPKAEAAALDQRAALFRCLGQWADAAALTEAALLLTPHDREMHRQAAIALGHAAAEIRMHLGEDDVAGARKCAAYYFRGLDHLETYLMGTSRQEIAQFTRSGGVNFMGDFFHGVQWGMGGHPSAAMRQAMAEYAVQKREVLLRIARQRARDGRGDEAGFATTAIWDLPQEKACDILFDLLVELQDAPGAYVRVYTLGTHGYSDDILTSPAGRHYLDRAAALSHAETRRAAEELRNRLPQIAREGERMREYFQAATRPTTAPAGERSTYGRMIWRDEAGKEVKGHGEMIAAGDGIDVVSQYGGIVWVMQQRGVVKQAYRLGESNCWVESLVFDGRYAWASFRRHRKTPLLVRVDPLAVTARLVTEADGLPNPGDDDGRDFDAMQHLLIAPVAPGRVMVAASFGRSYLAAITSEGDGGVKVKVFHGERDEPHGEDKMQWRQAGIKFAPQYALTLKQTPLATMASGETKTVTRVLIGRDSRNVDAWHHPLVIDPEALTVAVLEEAIDPLRPDAFGNDGQAIYWGRPRWEGTDEMTRMCAPMIRRLGLPDLRMQRVAEVYKPSGRDEYYAVACLPDGRVVVAASRLYVAATPAGPYQPWGSMLPEQVRRTLQLSGIIWTNHYGIVLRDYNGGLWDFDEVAAGAPAEDGVPRQTGP